MTGIYTRRDMLLDKNGDVLPEAVIEERQRTALARRRRPIFANGTVNAYINWGRWVADCPNCNSGIACSPNVSRVLCIDCGAEYAVLFPGELDRIEKALLKRVSGNRNWYPHERAEDLEVENKLHGIEKEE